MAVELVTLPCLSDNYSFVIHDDQSGETAVVDVPEAGPILDLLSTRGWTLTHVLLTHHHWDHVDGLPDLLAKAPAKVIGAKADAHRLPNLDAAFNDGDTFELCGEEVKVFDVSGHTIGHIAFYMPASGILFTADSLMALGCGRLFEGTPAQMFESLSKLSKLPDDTVVCSGHEYTMANAAFAQTIDPENAALISRVDAIKEARAAGKPTVPSTLGLEKATNPFLRADRPEIAAHIGMAGSQPVDVFTEIRARKDRF